MNDNNTNNAPTGGVSGENDVFSYSSKSTRRAGNQSSNKQQQQPAPSLVEISLNTSSNHQLPPQNGGYDNNDDGMDKQRHSTATATSPDSNHSSSMPNSNNNDDDPGIGSARKRQQKEELRLRKYSITELIACLNNKNDQSDSQFENLPEDLHRRVLDFRLAQQKRLQKHGPTQKWGIYGMYLHLSNIRTDLEWAEDAAWRRQHGQPYLSWSDFDEAHNKGWYNKPWFTYGLILICTIMMIVEFAANDWKMESLEVNPLIGPSAETLVDLGALDTPKIVNDGQWWRLVSPVILHAGVVHWVINMVSLWFFGIAIEQSHGIGSTMLLFFVPAVGGNILSAIFLPQYISVGASGGIFGFIGGCLADITVNWNLLFLKDCGDEDNGAPWKRNAWAFFWIVVETTINVLLGLTPYIDNFIHLGGLVYGIACGWTIIEVAAVNFFGYDASLWQKARLFTFRFLGLFIAVVCIIITCAWLATFEEDNNPCPNCRYFNCIETRWWYCDDCDLVTADLYRTATTENEDGVYTSIDLTCPNGQVIESIDVSAANISDRLEIRDELPDYCRDNCPEVFS